MFVLIHLFQLIWTKTKVKQKQFSDDHADVDVDDYNRRAQWSMDDYLINFLILQFWLNFRLNEWPEYDKSMWLSKIMFKIIYNQVWIWKITKKNKEWKNKFRSR